MGLSIQLSFSPAPYSVRIFLFVLALALSADGIGQSRAEKEKIIKFKQDFMTGVPSRKVDTLVTSTALLTRERKQEVRCISIFPAGEQVMHEECYYNDTNVPEHKSSYTLPGKQLTGVTSKFDTDGSLEYQLDHDKGTWKVVKADHYPYYKVLERMRGKADSLIIAAYGQSFFNQTVRWSPQSSVIYDGLATGSGWCEYETWEPSRFMIRYAIRLADDEAYDDLIEVQLDSTGQLYFPFGKYDDIKGFEKVSQTKGMIMTKAKAIEAAVAQGMTANGDHQPTTELSWAYADTQTAEMYNGHFYYSVAMYTGSLRSSAPTRGTKVEQRFDVYIFNPWTGAFVEKKKMKAYEKPNRRGVLATDLLPVN